MNLRVPRILWAAMLGSTPVYGVLGFVIAPDDVEPDPFMFIGIVVVAIGSIISSFLLPPRLLKQALEVKNFEVEEVAAANDEAMFRDMPKKIRRFVNPERVRSEMLPAWQTAFIMSIALSEAVAIYGFVLSMLGHPPMQWLPFVGVGLILVALRFPTESRILGHVETVYDARMP